ncbi:hypothetical protein [Thalassospira profundimaris]|uniref:hypothetical protein n=1 Tax=Thalassospira profundimaris TaxID=502049 RepID=UPI000DEDA33E|nr:hypothetical protein [Thalassospira profundimaris]
MSIGADWRQISPGAGAQTANGAQQSAAKAGNPAQQVAENGESGGFASFLFGDDGFDFGDIIDVINPLQHIPVVGALYRELTGDQMGNGARIVGGGLFGGVFGLAGAAVDAAVEGFTGEDTGAHVLALFEGGDDAPDPTGATAIAQNDSAHAGSSGKTKGGSPDNGLVLPWSAGDTSLASVMAGDQATAQSAGAAAPSAASSLPFDPDVADVASGDSVAENIAQSAAGMATTRSAYAPSSVVQPDGQEPPQPENPFEKGAVRAAQNADPAELAVTLARAGHSDYASRLTAQRETGTVSSRSAGTVHVNYAKGATVWQRAEHNGRVSGPSFGGDVQGELIRARSRQGSAETETMNPALMTDAAMRDDFQSGPALSPAEMAARFNSALGLAPASTGGDTSTSSHKATSHNRVSASAENRKGADRAQQDLASDNAASKNVATAEEHPLLREAEQHDAGQAPVGAWFSQTMMDGLQKYQAMQKRQQSHGSI